MKDPRLDPMLEAALHETLRKLPLHRAPESLAPRVLEVIAAGASKPWWQRAWWEWPVAAQVGFAAVALLLAAAAGGGGWWLNENVTLQPVVAVEQNPTVIGWKESFSEFLGGFAAWWQSYGQPWLVPGLAAVAIAYLLCLAGGTLLVRMATNSTMPRAHRRSGGGSAVPLFFA